jgi:hypothetical protein
MNLKNAINFVCAGIIYTIVLKISLFLIPDLFTSINMIKAIHILSFLTSLTVLLFGWYFIKEIISKNNTKLKIAVWVAMIGPAFFTLRRLFDIIWVFNDLSLMVYKFSPGLYHFISSSPLNAFSPTVVWLSALFIFHFFYLLFKQMNDENAALKKAIFLVLIGAGLTIIFRSFAFFTSLFFADSALIHDPPGIIHGLGFLIFLFTSLVILNFLRGLYQTEDYSKIITPDGI